METYVYLCEEKTRRGGAVGAEDWIGVVHINEVSFVLLGGELHELSCSLRQDNMLHSGGSLRLGHGSRKANGAQIWYQS